VHPACCCAARLAFKVPALAAASNEELQEHMNTLAQVRTSTVLRLPPPAPGTVSQHSHNRARQERSAGVGTQTGRRAPLAALLAPGVLSDTQFMPPFPCCAACLCVLQLLQLEQDVVRGLVLRQPSLLARASEGLQSKVKEYADIFEDEVGVVSVPGCGCGRFASLAFGVLAAYKPRQRPSAVTAGRAWRPSSPSEWRPIAGRAGIVVSVCCDAVSGYLSGLPMHTADHTACVLFAAGTCHGPSAPDHEDRCSQDQVRASWCRQPSGCLLLNCSTQPARYCAQPAVPGSLF
jgi:hypothetical protein